MKRQLKRQSSFRRNVNEFFGLRHGEYEESRAWTNIGKAIATSYLLFFAPEIVGKYDILLVLLGLLIVPEIFKKLLTLKYGNGPSKP